MNILTFSPENFGGGSIIKLIELVIGLSKRNWNLFFISPSGFIYHNVKHYSIKKFSKLAGFLYILQLIFVSLYIILIERQRIDRIVTFSLLEGVVACFISKFSKRTKVIVALHGDWYTGIQLNRWNTIYKKFYIWLFLKFEKFVFNNSDLIIFVSQENFSRITRRTNIDENKAKVVYNNVNDSRTIELVKVNKINFIEDKIIGFVGNLFAKDKGVELLIKAFEIVVKTVPFNLKLVIVGDGPDKDYLCTLCKSLQIERSVLFTGYMLNPFPYIKSFDIFVLPSLHEGFNLSILEALYCDKVVIGSRVGGIPEALFYDELLFDPSNVEELASKISQIISNNDIYEKFLDLCKERKKNFTFDWVMTMENLILNLDFRSNN